MGLRADVASSLPAKKEAEELTTMELVVVQVSILAEVLPTM